MDEIKFARYHSRRYATPLLDRVQPRDQTGEGRLARAAPADDAEHLAGLNGERNIVERRRAFRAIAESTFSNSICPAIPAAGRRDAFAFRPLVHHLAEHLHRSATSWYS